MNLFLQKRMDGYIKACKYYFANKDLKKAGKYWNKFFGKEFPREMIYSNERKFTNQEVYDITDYLKETYYKAVGLI